MDAIIFKKARNVSPPISEVPLQIITESQNYTVPYTANYRITVVGGGGSGGNTYQTSFHNFNTGGGGGSGYFNYGQFLLNEGSNIYTTIGEGGNNSGGSSTGGTTSFGTYIAANGGQAPSVYRAGGVGGNNGTNGSYGSAFDDPVNVPYGIGGWLYLTENNVTLIGSNRLYSGDGGNGGRFISYFQNSPPTRGNSGCCIIQYLG